VDLPIVTLIDITERGRNSTLGHDSVCLTKQRFGDDTYTRAIGRSLDGSA
jgi:hypothetical protein